MPMYRQLWLAIIISTLLALAGSLLASLASARAYLEAQLSLKNTDNAAALALSMSRGSLDAVSVELAVSALFDSGHYESIRVVDPLGRIIVERVAEAAPVEAPVWFQKLVAMRPAPGHAQISNGWQQVGSITLVSQSRFAYGALWSGTLRMLGALALAGLAAGYLGTLILRRLKAPLSAVVRQAEAIRERRFTIIDAPDVPELQQLAGAMNDTVRRLQTMFADEATRLEAVRREANCDPLTGLANRNHFMARLREAALAEHGGGGCLFIVRVGGLAEINRADGREAGDALIRRAAAILDDACATRPEAQAARLGGCDLAILLPHLSHPGDLGDSLLSRLEAEAVRHAPDRVHFWIGAGHFDDGIAPSSILAQIDAALAGAEQTGRSGIRCIDLGRGEPVPCSAEDWERAIGHALELQAVRLVAFPVRTPDGALLHDECPLRLRLKDGEEWLPAGRFMPMAERLLLTSRLDLVAVALGVGRLEENPALPGVAINLSASSLADAHFRSALRTLLTQRAATSRLWLEVAESGVSAHFEAFRALCAELRGCGCRLGIEHFGHRFGEVGRLHGLGLDYLKVDASFVHCLDSHPGNQAFLRGLASIAHGIGIQVIAEGVASNAELEALRAAGFDGVTGPAVMP